MDLETKTELSDVSSNICCAADVLEVLMLAVDHGEIPEVDARNAVEWLSTCIRAEGRHIKTILRNEQIKQTDVVDIN